MKHLKQLRERYFSTLKHSDTEETIDLWFYRPIGFLVALLGERLNLTPNAITTAGIVLGIASGLLMFPASLKLNLIGFLLLVLADVCDSADGQLARMTKSYSTLGRILDGVSSDIWFASIYLCIALRFYPEWGIGIWTLTIGAAVSHAIQAAMADHYRQFHLFFVNGKGGSELDDSESVAHDYRSISFKAEPVRKLSLWFYWHYTKVQETFNPQMTRLRVCLRLQSGESLSPTICELVGHATLPLMKWTNVLTYNWRAITLLVSILVQRPWLYLICELSVFNVIMLYMVIRHEHICKTIYKNINI